MLALLPWAAGGVALLTLVGVPAWAWLRRGPRYASFAAVILVLSLPGAIALHLRLAALAPPSLRSAVDLLFLFGLVTVALHMGALVQPRLRSPVFRIGVSIPGQVSLAAGFLGAVWLLVLAPLRVALWAAGADSALAALQLADLLPPLLALASLVTSIRLPEELVRVRLAGPGDDAGPETVSRVPVERYRRRAPEPLDREPLRIVPVADPPLGPWQSGARLRDTLESRLAHAPDLVLCTGDFLTMEGRGTTGALAAALEPLRAVSDRCFAVFGNHDHEDAELVRDALKANGVELLVDQEACVDTRTGPVQLVGADYVGRGREQHIPALLERFPRRAGQLRILMLHDPLGFREVPKDDVDLTLSGHTHGGQIGLVSLGLDWTVLSRSRWPDHGLFAHGRNRLYVHRGTGFYGFPLRIGVPGEASLLELVLPEAPA